METQNLMVLFILSTCFIVQILSGPLEQSLVVSSTTSPEKETGKEEGGIPAKTVQIYKMHIQSNIQNRFAHTTVTSKVKNYAYNAEEAVFSIVLPDYAFISGFIMEVGGKNYTAYVTDKEEAKRVYNQAIASGLAAAHVSVSARDSKRFTVSVNIQPESKAAFYLDYEQLLKRENGLYEQVINIHPGQLVKDLSVEVVISESKKIVNLKAPPLRSGNEIGTDKDELDPRADLQHINDTSAIVTFSPNLERQKELAHVFGTDVENGLAGQFVVQYDVERDPQGGEVLIQDGYFVHFFAPSDLKPLPKQVVFVLDTSGSMWGDKIKQLREAMNNILDQLNEHDSFNLVEFNSFTKVWNLDNPDESVWYPRTLSYSFHSEQPKDLETIEFPRAHPANSGYIQKAKLAIAKLEAGGSTGIYGALKVGLHLVQLEKIRPPGDKDVKRQPIIIFLTDGDPTDLSTSDITTKITEYNSKSCKAPIFALSFGAGVDMEFLQKLSLRNSGFSKHIYEAADASLQLQEFYKHISSPLLSNVTFKYEPSITSLTITQFPIHFGGSEIVVAGFCGTQIPTPIVDCTGRIGRIILKPVVTTTVSNTERLWAYLTIKQLLDKEDTSENGTENFRKEALDLALKHKFVTPVSSLIVVKPNDTKAIDTEEAEIGNGSDLLAASVLVRPIKIGTTIFGKSPPYLRPRPSVHLTTRTPMPMLQTVLNAFPWLSNILTSDLVRGPTGSYKLGLNETIPEVVPCPKATNDLEGHCTLLHDCVQAALPTITDYYNHFCVLRNEFAGVCCPN